MSDENLDGGGEGGQTQTIEAPTNEQVNQEFGLDGGRESSEPRKVQQQIQAPDYQAQIQQAMRETQEARQQLNSMRSEFGKFRQMQSEWDKQKTQTQNQTPASWQQLDEKVRQQTKEIVKAAWEEQYGKDWAGIQDNMNQFASTRQQQEVLTDVQRIAGKDFAQLDDIMGNIYLGAKRAAENGDQEAAAFIKELSETKSARYRLVDMARATFQNSQQAKSQTAQTQQQQARNNAATAVKRSTQASTQTLDLESAKRIRDPKARLEALRNLMDGEAQG